MRLSRNRLIAFAAGLTWFVLASNAVKADDTELFVADTADVTAARPNILLILDDSSSMDSQVITQNNYDPSTTYAGSCDATRVYWSTDGTPPGCSTGRWFPRSRLVCARALTAFAAEYGGMYTDNMAAFDAGEQSRWEPITNTERDRYVECQDDRPDPPTWAGHGSGASATEVYARNGNAANPWSSNAAEEITWGSAPANETYTLFDGNFMNYLFSTGSATTRLQIMKEVASNLVNSVNGVNFGLMSFNTNGLDGTSNGGVVLQAVEDATTGRAGMLAGIDNLVAGGFTPLSETLYEAYQYLAGRDVVYGTDSVTASHKAADPTEYASPIDFECQKTHVVLLTDGEPTNDEAADAAITGLFDFEGASFATLTGSATCDVETYPAELSPTGGQCLDDLAAFMYAGDGSPRAGRQSITTHTIGFLIDLPVLEETAERGGGRYYMANDTTSLTTALTNIITSILDTQATFTAPGVSINNFNQTRNLDDLYFGVFRPTGTAHWPGNLKKYKLRASDATIVDADGNPAIDPATGFFSATARSFWTVGRDDGADVEAGGAAAQVPTGRRVYTYLTDNPQAALTHSRNRVSETNPLVDDALLGTGAAGDPSRDEVISFILGSDASDVDGDGNLTEPRSQLGDPLHAQPVTVIYGPTADDARVFFATNDGFLHSIDTRTGEEIWSFVPEEFLPNQIDLFKDNQTGSGNKLYGIDGSLRLQIVGDTDGIVEPDEKVYLFFGMRRGGDAYYALDVTQKDAPRVLWRLDGNDLPGLGQSWSSATPARIDVNSTQSSDKLVVVIGGGYDPNQDSPLTGADTMGNAIYIVDSENGDLLWHGGPAGQATSQNKTFADMTYSIPADVRVIDLNGDQLADRMYASDMGGQIWRFDIFNRPADPDTLVTGGVIAQLGAAAMATPTLEASRRFYYAPDIALVNTGDYNYLHIGIGSGYRAHPNETANQNRFYALRDYNSFTSLPQSAYDLITPVTDGDLVDVTTNLTASVPQGSPGWKLRLDDGGWRGEKVLAETRTFNNRVFVTTFRPGGGTGCEPSLGTSRQYVMSLFNGAPVNNRDQSTDVDGDGDIDADDDIGLSLEDRYIEYPGPPPPETVFIFADDPACVGNQCPPIACVDLSCGVTDFPNVPIRTFWTQESVD